MYSFDGLNGQTLTIDLPLRPQDYNVTLYDPSGAATAVISATTTPAYGGSVTLTSSGRYTVSVSQPSLTPTEDQYQLLVTDENCVASDANEPNDSAAFATPLSNGSRVRATLCSGGDVDLYSSAPRPAAAHAQLPGQRHRRGRPRRARGGRGGPGPGDRRQPGHLQHHG